MRKVRKIEPSAKLVKPKLRVAAYARVSTDNDEQLISLEAQKLTMNPLLSQIQIGSLPEYTLTKVSQVQKRKSL